MKGCLSAIFGGLFPRLAVLFIWLARPVLFSAAMGRRWPLPLLGIIFLPFTTPEGMLGLEGLPSRTYTMTVRARRRSPTQGWPTQY